MDMMKLTGRYYAGAILVLAVFIASMAVAQDIINSEIIAIIIGTLAGGCTALLLRSWVAEPEDEESGFTKSKDNNSSG